MLPLIAYALLLIGVFFFQRALIYPRSAAGSVRVEVSTLTDVEQVELTSSDATRIVAWFAVGDGCSADHPGPGVIFAHGNGELIDDNLDIVAMYRRLGVSVLLVEYRGYGRASGSPSQRVIVSDFTQFRDWLDARPEVDRSRIIYHGRSLGGGVVCALAADRPPVAVIVESTFTSMTAMFGRYLMPAFVCRDPYRTDRVLPSLGVPVVVMHGSRDRIVPVAHGRRLAEIIPGATYLEFDCGHNDMPAHQDRYQQAVRTLVEGARASGPRERPR